MSEFKAYKSFLVDIGNTPKGVKEEFKKHIIGTGWQLIAETDTSLDLLPSSPVGNEFGNNALRIVFNNGNIGFQNLVRKTESEPTRVSFGTGYTNSYLSQYGGKLIIKINDVEEQTISTVGKSFNNQNEFMNYLVMELNSSINPNVSKFTFLLDEYRGSDRIVAQVKNLADNNIVLSTNTDVWSYPGYTANTYKESRVFGDKNFYPSVSVDYGTGFIYFLSIHERTISLSAKTTQNHSPIICATFVDNTLAKANTPPFCTPVELILTFGRPTGWRNSYGDRGYSVSHGYGYFTYKYSNDYPPLSLYNGRGIVPIKGRPFQDIVQAQNNQDQSILPAYIHWFGLSVINGNEGGDYLLDITKFNPVINPLFQGGIREASSAYTMRWGSMSLPSYILDDVYYFSANGTDESLHLTQDETINTKLTAEASASDLEIQVGSTEGFPPRGTITIDSEIIEYTSKTDTSFTGLTRGMYGTTPSSHISTANIYVLLWFTKVGQQVLLAGYTRPTGA